MANNLIIKQDRDDLFLKVKHELGYPLRPFELKGNMMASYLEMCIEDYSSYINEWLIEQQWINLEGNSKQNTDFVAAFSTKSSDYIRSFTYSYSRQVGLGTNAPAAHGWELKRDFIVTSGHTQHYIIPAGREVNDVLWETPPSIQGGMVDPFAANMWTPGLNGWSYAGRPAMYVQPTYSTLLGAQDWQMKKKIIQSTMTYRITGLETGEKMLHLYPIPGSRNEISGQWGKHYAGRQVFYWYYDTTNDNVNKCKQVNSDIIILPSDTPTSVLKWKNINDVAKQIIRDLLIAKVKMVIGGVRGFYSGNLGVAEKQVELDYRHLLDEGIKLKEETITRLKESLVKMSQLTQTENRARIAENVNKERSYQAIKHPIMVF